jgi:hypothetical protein
MSKTSIEWTEQLFGAALPRRCRGCCNLLPIDAFKIDRSRPDGHGYICKPCERVTPAHIPTAAERADAVLSGKAWCCDCEDWVSTAEISNSCRCRFHQRCADRERYLSDPEYRAERRAHAMRRKRGVDPVPEVGREALTHLFGGKCAYCPAAASTWDHVIPVSQGGQTTPDNILPSCTPCNSSKRHRNLLTWIDETGRALDFRAAERLAHFQVLDL